MIGRISLRALLAVGPLAAGCDFFEELQDAESAGSGTASTGSDQSAGTGSEGGSETGSTIGDPCTVAQDDRCKNQDVIRSCDPATGTLTEIACDALCGDNSNFSCVAISQGQHGCWCVVPGPNKLASCSELEGCLGACTEPGPCTDQCFSRTTEVTIRTFGALIHCAQSGCDETCADMPEQCGACVARAIETGQGCSLERAVCDADTNDDGWGYP